MNFIVIGRRTLWTILLFCLFVSAAFIWYSFQAKVSPAFSVYANDNNQIRQIHMVTGEFKTAAEDGKEIEAYRFDPGTIFLKKGEKVHLKIYGVNGKEHPFIIENTDIQGTVQKGKETVIPLQFHKPGTYRLICLTHQNYENNGPMIAYIVVN